MSCKCDTINIVNDNNVIVVSHADGRDGKSAYQQAVDGGYTGTEQEFNCSLSLLADVAEGKKQIADAINTKGGNSTPDESFQKLASDIKTLPYAGISAEGIVQTAPFEFLSGFFSAFYAVTEIIDNQTTEFTSRLSYNTHNGSTLLIFPNLKIMKMYKLRIIKDTQLIQYLDLEYCEFPTLDTIQASALGSEVQKNLIVGTLITCASPFYRDVKNLRNITIGQDTNIDLPFNKWKATNVIAEGQSGIDELNENLRTNLLEKLYDHSEDGQTRTLRLGWLAHVTQENIDYANSKGWTLTT
jgi:hypothetical protein